MLTKTCTKLTADLSVEEFETYETTIQSYKKQYEAIQDILDGLVEEKNLEQERDYRFNIYEQIQGMIVTISKFRKDLGRSKPATPVPPTLCTTSNINFVSYQEDESFLNFVKRLETFMFLKGSSDNKTKVYTLLHALTPQLHEKLYDIYTPENPLDKDYDELVRSLQDYLEPRPSTWALQNKFINRSQDSNESVLQFSTELKKLSKYCEFKCGNCQSCTADAFLNLQFIRGLRDPDIRTRILQDKTTNNFKDVLNLAMSVEISKIENDQMNETKATSAGLNQLPTYQTVSNTARNEQRDKIVARQNLTKQNKPVYQDNMTRFSSMKGKCYRCGDLNHRASDCKFRNEYCRRCNKLGHIGKVCMSSSGGERKIHLVEEGDDEESDNQYEIYKLQSTKTDKFMIEVDLEKKHVHMEIDTGAALSSISLDDYKKLNLDNRIFKTNIQMKTYTGEIIKPRGVCFVKCTYKKQEFIGKLVIINQRVDPIFGRDWIREVSLDWAEIKNVKSTEAKTEVKRLEDVLTKYEDVFQDKIGTIPSELGHLELKPDATPIFHPPRPVPYSKKLKVEQELERLEKENIITRIDHSNWGTPIVPITKPNGDVRVCADYKVTLNSSIQDFNYPIPRIEDIFAQMNGGRYFCTLDLNKAYLHYKMDDESAILQCLSTHKGLFKVNRLMFGVKVAPGMWQKFMDKTLQGIAGVQCFF